MARLEQSNNALPLVFYRRDAISVAQDLLGKTLESTNGKHTVNGIIAETEAYCGVLDRACHAFGFRRTQRTEPMYGVPGTAYVYLIYGLHHCLNVVCLQKGAPQAVLIRSVKPQRGIEIMAKRRNKESFDDKGRINPILADGPGKLCEAFNVDVSANGLYFNEKSLMIKEGQTVDSQMTSKRVGLGQVGEFEYVPWRFEVQANE